MSLTTLRVTCDSKGAPNRQATSLLSTRERLTELLHRSALFSYVSAVYNTDDVLFIKDIYEDLVYEINSIRKSNFRETSNFENSYDAKSLVDYQDLVLQLCSFYIGESKLPPIGAEEFVKAETYVFTRRLASFYEAWSLFCFANAKRDVDASHIESFIVSNVRIPILRREGFSIHIDTHENFYGQYEYSNELVNQFVGAEILAFQGGLLIPDANIDTYMILLGCTCIEPNINMLRFNKDQYGTASSMQEFLHFIEKTYCSANIYTVIHDITHGRSIISTGLSDVVCKFFVHYMKFLYERYNINVGKITANIINVGCNTKVLPPQRVALLNYLKKVLSGNEEVVTSEEKLSFVNSDIYSDRMYVDSPLFIAADEDDDSFEEDEDTDEENPDDETEDTEGDDLEEDDLEAEGDEDDLEEDPEEEDPAEEPEDTPEDEPTDDPDDLEGSEDETEDDSKKKPESTNDKVGIQLARDNVHTLDSYLYRREVDFVITNILKNPPEGASVEDLAVLKRLKTQWLYLLSIGSIHEILKKVVKLPVKLVES